MTLRSRVTYSSTEPAWCLAPHWLHFKGEKKSTTNGPRSHNQKVVELEFKPQRPGFQAHTSNLDPIAVHPKVAGVGPGPDPTSLLGRKISPENRETEAREATIQTRGLN